MERISWSQVRSRLEPELSLELRLCLELLWVMPPPEAGLPLALLPSNVLVGADGTVVLGPTSPEDFLNQTRYVAPELTTAGGALASAIYAVGAMLYEAVSGLRFESSEAVGREVRSRRARAVTTGTRRDAVEIELLELALKATQPSHHPRWATPESFSRELGHIAGDRIATREQLAEFVIGLTQEKPASSCAPPAAEATKPRSFRQPTATSYSETTSRIEVLTSPKRRLSAVEVTGPLRSIDAREIDTSGHDSAAPLPPGPQSRTLRGFSLDLTGYPAKPGSEAEPGAPDSAGAGARAAELATAQSLTEAAPASVANPDIARAPSARGLTTESLLHDAADLDPRPSPHRTRVAAVVTTALLAAALVFMVVRGAPTFETRPPSEVRSISPAQTEVAATAHRAPERAEASENTTTVATEGIRVSFAQCRPGECPPEDAATTDPGAPARRLGSPPQRNQVKGGEPASRNAAALSRPAAPPAQPKSKTVDYPDYGI